MEFWGRQIPLLYILLLPYIPFLLFWLIIFSPLFFIWIIGDVLTGMSLGFFKMFDIIVDFMFPRVKICNPNQLRGGK
jgi:hypothetical protein